MGYLVFLFFYLMSAAGMTIIVTKSTLFEPIRNLFLIPVKPQKRTLPYILSTWTYKLLSCPLCFGFLAGLLVFGILFFLDNVGVILCLSFCTSAFSYWFYKMISK